MNTDNNIKDILNSLRPVNPGSGFRRDCIEAAERAMENRRRIRVLAPTGVFSLSAAAGLALVILSVLRMSAAAETPDAKKALASLVSAAMPAARQSTVSSLHNCFSALEECAKCARKECARGECAVD
ncbi:MAG: hypothetical protein CVU77_08240 [Elusimicrobia bacterium HGW-Elusimicrobia-1]|jgi:hypothetical protein|nr:MAG: hypothetical protein CVU77_08240 [Elusimicrobia bacterium HGW-Elusimicrobia-1]